MDCSMTPLFFRWGFWSCHGPPPLDQRIVHWGEEAWWRRIRRLGFKQVIWLQKPCHYPFFVTPCLQNPAKIHQTFTLLSTIDVSQMCFQTNTPCPWDPGNLRAVWIVFIHFFTAPLAFVDHPLFWHPNPEDKGIRIKEHELLIQYKDGDYNWWKETPWSYL